MSRDVRAVIDLNALQHNYQRAKQVCPNAKVMAVVKANAYGHGIEKIAKALSHADGFAVACIDEAEALRQQNLSQPILLIEGFLSQWELDAAVENQCDVVIHNQHQLDLLASTDIKQPLNCWLKVDTGMHRLGFTPEQASTVYEQLSNNHNVNDIVLMTHFSCADDINNTYTSKQQAIFNDVVSGIVPANGKDIKKSLANSAAVLGWPETCGDWTRPGLLLYGASPFVNRTGETDGLKPVMTLQSKIISIRELNAGDAIGYGATWTCAHQTRLGVVAIGYGNGYPRSASAGTPVLVVDAKDNTKKVPIIGRVSMRMITVDLNDAPAVQVGDTVTLWGKGLPIEEVARDSGTIAYDLLTGVMPFEFEYELST